MLQDENAKFEPPSESDYTPNGYQAKRFVEHGQRAKRGLCVDAQGPCDAVVKVREKAGNSEAEVKKNEAGEVLQGVSRAEENAARTRRECNGLVGICGRNARR